MKPKVSLLPAQGILLAADVMTRAESPEKYPTPAWPFISTTEHVNSAMRHLLAWLSGDLVDEELGTSHLANASCRLLMATAVEHLASATPPVSSDGPPDTVYMNPRWEITPEYEKWVEEQDRKYYGEVPQPTLSDFPPADWDRAALNTKPLWSHHTASGDTTRIDYESALRQSHRDSE